MSLPSHSTRGFSLVEVTLALGVAAFCLVAIFGLLPVGVNNNQNSLEQTTAANLAGSIVADLRAAPAISTLVPAPQSPQFGIPLPTTSTASTYSLFLRVDGSLATTAGTSAAPAPGADAVPAQNPHYRVTLTFVPPATGQRTSTGVRVQVTWPALADRQAATTPTHFAGTFEILTALDRN